MKRVLAILKKLHPIMSRLITMAIMVSVFYCMFMFADLDNEKSDSERSVNFEEMSDQEFESEDNPAGSMVNYCKDSANESRSSSWFGMEVNEMEPSEYTVECIEHLE
ncbi:hypothetical protein OCO53_20710 [Peribacillus frigoritolerans]|uniref:hypothetical protein n=1 Tax=Peribacillus frigoritolerans TaxID=450367 RepID=UPI0021CE124F|nr:hypothetical protein [Peribacillus frigoritolerans]MCU6602878.1 hypothetical protein [Peribacillus frigoritolerans]